MTQLKSLYLFHSHFAIAVFKILICPMIFDACGFSKNVCILGLVLITKVAEHILIIDMIFWFMSLNPIFVFTLFFTLSYINYIYK